MRDIFKGSFEDIFSRINIGFAIILLALGGLFGVLQLLSRTPGSPIKVSAATYYQILTGHGVFLAVAFTLFFIMGLTVFMSTRILKVDINRLLLKISLCMTLLGAVLAAVSILTGKARVLYTFYAPMKAHPFFYIGAALLILGSWFTAFALFLQYLKWRKQNPDREIPVPIFGLLATWIVWIEATIPVVIDVLKVYLPMALLGASVDVLEARTWFWFFGHPLVYFWLLPAITLWYYLIPKRLGVELFSKKMAKIAFILFIIYSTPIGLHHQLVDPGVDARLKYLHTVLTLIVGSASMLTAFNILATLERAGRKAGGGFFGWIIKLPWRDPIFSGMILALIAFGFGGITGIINTSYQLNNIVHNTSWIVGHFHTTVGTAVALTFMVASYGLLTELFNRKVIAYSLARIHPYLWVIGIFIFSTNYALAGLAGAPRRTYDLTFGGMAPEIWYTYLKAGAVGGVIFALAGAIFVLIFILSILVNKGEEVRIFKFGNPHENLNEKHSVIDNIKLWIVVAVILIILGYSIPLYQLYSQGLSLVPPVAKGL